MCFPWLQFMFVKGVGRGVWGVGRGVWGVGHGTSVVKGRRVVRIYVCSYADKWAYTWQ